MLSAGKSMGDNTPSVLFCENTEEAVKEIKELWKKDDVILLKASNGMKFDKILERIR